MLCRVIRFDGEEGKHDYQKGRDRTVRVTSSRPFEAVVAAIDKKKSQMISCDLHGVETAAT
jgi:hypothetical protein